MAHTVQTIKITDHHAGQRLDNFLFGRLKGVPKTHVYKLIRSGQVRVNKKRAKADTKLALADMVRIPPVRTSQQDRQAAHAAPAKTFDILYEDDYLLAINKPEGIAVHGGSGISYGVIESARAARPASNYLELVHRLDKETSGVLLMAKKRSALTHLQAQFKHRNTFKLYLAGVHGEWEQKKINKHLVIDTPLHKYLLPNGERRVKITNANDPLGKRAVSIVKGITTVKTNSNAKKPTFASLAEVSIKTGRTHQIRVHLASIGHPILGDTKYTPSGVEKAAESTKQRMFLHAHKLHITHPVSEQRLEIIASAPVAFRELFVEHTF